ncbi:MAG: segregation/condensation protein A [Eubacteriales bacterium]|nr:segregation/condensation protein A [Eubacteriales bacterium]MDD3199116.1 segregation/condensation protein A [Eubacteriales bacterium]MDD4121509.1 segregation/condensation protein A [Eubacteriales bacterium]MDD4629641.1 segregation/condensation protein A [Eubacteriales bacterium]
MSYKIKLDIFEGPFDLLVYLIENARMSIYDIQISEITDQYLRYLKRMQALDINVATEFMVLAAALIEIKSKMLLPRMKQDGGVLAEEDPRTELVQRILEYKRFKTAAELLEQQEEYNQRIFEKPKEDLTLFASEAEEYLNLDLKQFVKVFHLFLRKKKNLEDIQRNYSRVERRTVSVESKIDHIKSVFRVKAKRRLNFKELLAPQSNRSDVVITFVSVLEMMRQKTMMAKQNVNFGEIILSLNDNTGNGKKNPAEGDIVS